MARAAALALLVVLSGCSVGAGPGTPTETLTPAPVDPGPTVTPATGGLGSLPPGVEAWGLADPGVLAAAHVEALSGRSFTVRRESVQRYRNGTVRTRSTVRVQVATPARYHYSVGFVGEVERFGTGAEAGSLARWANGSAVYRRLSTGPYPAVSLLGYPGGEPVAPVEVYHGEPFGSDRLGQLLDGALNVTVTPRPATEVYRLRIRGWSGDSLATPSGLVRNASVERAVLEVTPAGLVRRVTVRYTGTVGGRRVEGRYRTRYGAIGETVVDRPVWVADADHPPPPPPTPTPTPAEGGRVPPIPTPR